MTNDTTTTNDTRTRSVALYGWTTFAEGELAIRAAYFGKIVRLITPIVKHYHSDLYHDAMVMQEHVNGEGVMHLWAGDCGTWFLRPETNRDMTGNGRSRPREYHWTLTLRCDTTKSCRGEGYWYLDVEADAGNPQ